jgi:hypothetical protein
VLVPREREEVLRERDPLLREDFAAPPVDDDFAAEVEVDLRAPLARADPLPDDFAREEVDLRAPPLLELERDPVERALADREPLERDELDRPLPALRVLPPRDDELDEDEPVPELPADDSSAHLPDMTRCAASATASAISEPSLVALAITLLAA